MSTAVIPVPPGFRAVPERLAWMVQSGLIERYEDLGSELHLYMTRLDPGATIELGYQLEATAACTVTRRGAQVYAYYEPDRRGSSAGMKLTGMPQS